MTAERAQTEVLLDVRGLTKRFGGVVAVDSVDITIERGALVGLIGPNGAGKTTVFNLISGVYRPTSGSIILGGREVSGLRPFQMARAGIARTFQNIRLFRHLSVMENVRTACHLEAAYSLWDALVRTKRWSTQDKKLEQKARSLLELVGLADRGDEFAASLPYGYQRRLEVARALALSPQLLLLDEPTAGMNPHERETMAELFTRVRRQFNLTILLIEHHMDMVMELAEFIYVLNFGRLIAAGPPAAIQENPEVVRAYLGEEGE